MLAVPASSPVNRALAEPVDTIDPSAVLLHVPPAERSLSSIDAFTHTEVAPIMLDGTGFTVTTTVAAQPALA